MQSRLNISETHASRLEPHATGIFHAMVLGAALAVFVFILCWSSEATGFFPPAGKLIDLINMDAARRGIGAFWQGSLSAALVGGAIGALIALSASGIGRLLRRR